MVRLSESRVTIIKVGDQVDDFKFYVDDAIPKI
jgi:hypothetical protein